MWVAFLCLDKKHCLRASVQHLLIQCAKWRQQSKSISKTCMYVCGFSSREELELERLTKDGSFLTTIKSWARLGQGFLYLLTTWSIGYSEASFFSLCSHFSHSQLGWVYSLIYEWKEGILLSKKDNIDQKLRTLQRINYLVMGPELILFILGSRYSWYFGSSFGGQEHHWDAGYNCTRTSSCCCALCDGCLWTVWA